MYFTFVTNVVNMWQEFLKKEQERKKAELLAEKQEVMRKRKEEERVAREVKNMCNENSFFHFPRESSTKGHSNDVPINSQNRHWLLFSDQYGDLNFDQLSGVFCFYSVSSRNNVS